MTPVLWALIVLLLLLAIFGGWFVSPWLWFLILLVIVIFIFAR